LWRRRGGGILVATSAADPCSVIATIEVKRVFFGRDPSAQREWATRTAHQLIGGQSRAPSL